MDQFRIPSNRLNSTVEIYETYGDKKILVKAYSSSTNITSVLDENHDVPINPRRIIHEITDNDYEYCPKYKQKYSDIHIFEVK